MNESSKSATTPEPLTQADWERYNEEWALSGESQPEFCKRRGLSYSTFVYWRSKLTQSTKPKSSTFEGIQISSQSSASGAIQVMLPNGVRLSIQSNAQTSLLKEIFHLLGVSSC